MTCRLRTRSFSTRPYPEQYVWRESSVLMILPGEANLSANDTVCHCHTIFLIWDLLNHEVTHKGRKGWPQLWVMVHNSK